MYKLSIIKRLQASAVFLSPAAASAHPGGVLHDIMHDFGSAAILLVAVVVFPALCRLAAMLAKSADRATRRPGPD